MVCHCATRFHVVADIVEFVHKLPYRDRIMEMYLCR